MPATALDREQALATVGVTVPEDQRDRLEKESLTPYDVSQIVGVSPQSVHRALDARRLKCRTANVAGKRYRSIYWDDLLAWAQARADSPRTQLGGQYRSRREREEDGVPERADEEAPEE